MDSKDPTNIFDWNFSDSPGGSARNEALRHRPSETSMLMELINADSLIHFALSSELPRNHPVGELWLETQTDLHATIYLAYGGYFRQAFTILRSWFEIAVHGVFFSAHYGQPTGRYEKWRNGQRDAPANMQKIASSLASRPNKLFQINEDAIFQKLNPIYTHLAQQAHGQGLDIYDLQEGRDNVPRFLPKSYDLWYGKVFESFDTVCFLYRLFFQKELASYFSKYSQERRRFGETKKALSVVMPELDNLATNILKKLGTTS